MASEPKCPCRCHSSSCGDLMMTGWPRIVVHAAGPGVSCADPLEAVIACADCRKHHCVALLTPRSGKPAAHAVEPWREPDDCC